MRRPVAIPFIISLMLHLAVIALLLFNFSFSSPTPPPPPMKIIEAKLVSMEQLPALRAKPKSEALAEPKPIAEEPKPEPVKPEPVKPQPPKPEPPKPEPPKPEPYKPDIEKQKQIEKQKELEKQIQVEKEKAELQQKKLAEQKKQEEERKRKETEEAQKKKQQEEAQRKKQQEDAQKKAQEDAERKKNEQRERDELKKAMAAEDDAMAAERDQEAIASFEGKIVKDIERSWSRPPSARLGMQVTLAIQLIHTGEVVNVSVLKSSGSDAFDQSAITAVRRVGKFPYLRDVSDRQFDQKFRPLVLVFNPVDLRQ